MKTEVLMKRKLFNCEISQKSKTGYFSATELVKAGNKWRVTSGISPFDFKGWLQNKSTKEFISQLREETGEDILISGRGRGHHTWVHPFLFIDIALSVNVKLKIEVYNWMYDSLIKYRNDSGDSYKKMAGALYLTCSDKTKFKKEISNVANMIKIECDVTDWQNATEKQLKLRDKMHEYISLFTDIIRDRKSLFNMAIKKAKEEVR